ncbi:U3 snoRNP protein [Phlyctochytrium planicorne]|nr:U3 snoRNP protein [Phlyctochytrium planicorne]
MGRKKSRRSPSPPLPSGLINHDPSLKRVKEGNEDPEVAKDSEEIALEAMLFGGLDRSDPFDENEADDADEVDIHEQDDVGFDSASDSDKELFVIDKRKARIFESVNGDRRYDEGENDVGDLQTVSTEAKPLWRDESLDEMLIDIADGPNRLRKLRVLDSEYKITAAEYEQRLRRQFEKLHPPPAWANPKRKRGNEDEEESTNAFDAASVFRSSAALIRKSMARTLGSMTLDAHRVRDGNQMEPSSAVVQSCRFHPAAPILLTAGLDHTIRLFHIDGKLNPKVQSVYFADLPILCASFSVDGRQITASGRRKQFYVYDVESGLVERILGIRGRDEESLERHSTSPCGRFIAFLGRNGYIILVSRITKQWIANLKMNGSVRAIEFSKDGKYLYSIGGDGEIYQWDLASRSCTHRFHDEGSLKVSTLSISADNSMLATGSNSGIVNVYNLSSALKTDRPAPIKSLLNLATPISSLAFHPSSSALLFTSKMKKDALRIAHCPSLNVFSNWPTANTPLSYVNAVDWSPGGGFLAIGNDKGKALLYRLSAFDGC